MTSQLLLTTAGKRVLRLAPLQVVEGVGGPDGQEGAVALLIDRIRAADSRFDVTPGALPLLAALCRQLDGLPLALEMAAARVPLMGLRAVHEALVERFALLSRGRRDSPARHRSLLGALEWSYGLLDPAEQRLFRALGVFAGGFTLDLAVTLTSMDNAREAFAWARLHDLAAAAQLSARMARVIGFTVWRQEVTQWMLSLQPRMEQPAGRALPLPARAGWWTMLAYVLSVRRDAASGPAAKQAVSLWREAGDAGELQLALSIWVRSISEPGAELDEACRQLQQSMSTLGESPQSRLRVHGALAEAARLRGDRAGLLACREQELTSSLELGWQRTAQAAETNICSVLIELGRHAEAAARGHALLRDIDADAGDDNGNLPWALNVLVEALTALERWSEARALVPRSLDTSRRFGTTVAWQGVLALVAAQERHAAAGRLLGHVRRQWQTSGASPDRDEPSRLEQVETAVRARLGADAAATLAAQGWGLDDAAAARLAAQDID